MRWVRYLWITTSETLLRMFPFPCRTGLVRIGNPGRQSPVLLTCNFRLTVARVQRALKGVDAYLLVANSRGINVWCASTGGLLTNHDVVSALKTTGIEELVDHRQVVLPQLAATGVERRYILERTGWSVLWGPVEAGDIAAFLRGGLKKTREMRSVRFRWPQRMEMAVAWAFPISALTLVLMPFWPEGVLPLASLVWGFSLVLFLSFPLYERHLRPLRKSVGFVSFAFGERGVPLLLWLLFMLFLVVYPLTTGTLSWTFVLRWAISSLIVVLILGIDLTGSTPTYKSGLHADRRYRITLDEDRCEAAGDCVEVCPTDVLEIDSDRSVVALPRQDQCVQCGACIVQCPYDALYFAGPEGERISPKTLRQFKLNLMGKREVRTPASEDLGG